MVKAKCSPTATDNSFSCYSDKALEKIKHFWNARHPDAKITAKNDKDIWSALKENMSDVCESEMCWLRQQFMNTEFKSELLNYTFAPLAPKSWNKKPDEWLTSVDIEAVMKQYEYKHKNFLFIGPTPIDFDKQMLYNQCVWDELCKFNLKKLLGKGKTKIGIVFNVDPHNLDGSHWISMFIDINKKYIFFFDSVGDKPPKEITTLIERIKKQAKDLGINLKTIINKKAHQRGDTECGIYSLYLIIQLLQNKKTPKYFLEHRISDKEMLKLRKEYFNESV